MIRESKAIVAAAETLKAKNIAVLRFEVRLGSEKLMFRAGTMSSEMVRRVENVLILGADEQNPAYTVLTAADEVALALARQTKSAVDWTTPEGRKKLFDLNLPVAWDSDKKLSPEGYMTGIVKVTPDFKKVSVELYGFTKADPEPRKLMTLETAEDGKKGGIPVDPAMLASMGVGSDTGLALAPRGANDLANPSDKKPLDASPFPLKMEILFDGRVAQLVRDEGGLGEFQVTTPAAGVRQRQRVTFAIQNTGKERLAVLLCVNGRNTIAVDDENLDKSDKPRHKFRMWVLDPNKKYAVKGYLLDEAGSVAELLLPEEQASQGYDTIQVFVYGKPPPAPRPSNVKLPRTSDDPEIIARGAAFLATSPRGVGETRTLGAAKAAIKAQTRIQPTRGGGLEVVPESTERGGAIIPGPTTTQGKIQIVPFEYDDQPIHTLVITHHCK
jgi:hypothetical protein